MARKKGMMGPGSKAMGGAGIKPSPSPTPMAGRPPMGAPGGMPGGGLGAGPPRPPMGMPSPGGQRVAPSPAGGMGGAAGFKHGGEAEKKRDRHEKLARGGEVGEPKERMDEDRGERKAFNKGGAVGGGDVKGRVGRDRGGAGKAC
jgi:hypothetical protein